MNLFNLLVVKLGTQRSGQCLVVVLTRHLETGGHCAALAGGLRHGLEYVEVVRLHVRQGGQRRLLHPACLDHHLQDLLGRQSGGEPAAFGACVYDCLEKWK